MSTSKTTIAYEEFHRPGYSHQVLTAVQEGTIDLLDETHYKGLFAAVALIRAREGQEAVLEFGRAVRNSLPQGCNEELKARACHLLQICGPK